jgi:hypothetical protein
MSAIDCRPGRQHRFNRQSGWCVYGCGNRDDGRIVTRGGAEVRPSATERPLPPALDGFEAYRERMNE